jgi:hypothetical protein
VCDKIFIKQGSTSSENSNSVGDSDDNNCDRKIRTVG